METPANYHSIPISRKVLTLIAATIVACMVMLGGVTAANAAVVVGVCKLKIGNPHGSTHVSGTINSLSSIQCTIGMPSVHIQTWLYKSPSTYWTGKADSRVGVAANKKLQSNRAVSCSKGPGKFRNRTYVQFNSPSGVNPAYHANTYYSPWTSVACGVSRAAPESSEQQVVDISVMSDGTIEFEDPPADPAN